MNLVFNTSMPRSGSELLQVILSQHPNIYASVTSPLLEYQFAARGNYELPEVKSQDPNLMQKAFINMCHSMATGYYSEITNNPTIIDKNRGWSFYYEWVEQWNPNPKMICMVRDLRSIISSMEKIYRKNRHMPIGPDNPAQMQNLTLDDRANYWLNSQPVGLALQRTFDLFQRGVADKMLFVKYEDLCSNPQETMNTVLDFIGEESFEFDFENITKTVYEDHSLYGPYGNHSVQRVLVHSDPHPWANVLPRNLANSIRNNVRWYFDQFNY